MDIHRKESFFFLVIIIIYPSTSFLCDDKIENTKNKCKKITTYIQIKVSHRCSMDE